jgi:alpha-tubulin suppressor-like RCC1 family protein
MPRKRSISGGGALKEVTSAHVTRTLVQTLLQHHLQSTGKSILHSSSPALTAAVLERCAQLDAILIDTPNSSSLCRDLLWTRDVESGYTPLHWAIYQGDLLQMLLLLRATEQLSSSQNTTPTLIQRPMALLQGERSRSQSFSSSLTANTNTQLLSQAVDFDGKTPAALLADLQRSDLLACRKSLYQPKLISNKTACRRTTNFDFEEDEQDEFNVLRRGMAEYSQQQSRTNETLPIVVKKDRSTVTYGCEVLTFGGAHHCALGVVASKTTTAEKDTKVRPQRVQAFAQQDGGDAVAVAGATHHTLVATATGHLYAFGLGKGGRLGTGSDAPCSLPTRVEGLLLHQVVLAVAAAENHSLCVCRSGEVFAWGSNRFGQLGMTNPGDERQSRCCVPHRVDDLKNVACVSVAAGERHSVALSKLGEVYVWGDNTAGQLGMSRRSGTHKVQRVEALWKNNNYSAKTAIAISASSQTTLVLTAPTRGLVNSVYWWGHGSDVPSRVHFESPHRPVLPAAIACARYHNVLITVDGDVYTWGLHADALGTQKTTKSTSSPTPQLVTGMLPQNGGGIAVAVAASENHTAVVTDTGALFTWGATYGKNILGHEGVRWQPDPKRVPGVHRAVGVAAAKEHTVLLMGACFPAMVAPTAEEDTLENCAARKVAEHVDLFNALPCLIMAERMQNLVLRVYCVDFIKRNMDGVINVCQKSVMNSYLTEQLATSLLELDNDRDGTYHPLLLDAVVADCSDRDYVRLDMLSRTSDWLETCFDLSESSTALSLIERYKEESATTEASSGSRRRSKSITTEEEPASVRCADLLADFKFATKELAELRLSSLTKEVRAIRKRLGKILKLEEGAGVGAVLLLEEEEKISRKPQLKTDLKVFELAVETVRQRLKGLLLAESIEQEKESGISPKCFKDEKKPLQDVSAYYRCDICKVSSTDEKNFELHRNGRKHRNRLAQVAEDEEKKAAKAMMEKQQRQLLQGSLEVRPLLPKTAPDVWSSKKPKSQPVFNLPPPPHPVPSSMASPSASQGSPSLLEIMAEESKKTSACPKSTKKKATKGHQLFLPAGSAPQMKSPPWASAPVRSVHATTIPSPPAVSPVATTPLMSKPVYSLGDFMPTPGKVKGASPQLPRSWASPKAAATPPPSSSCSVSFQEIQREEKDFKANKEDQSFGANGKWFIERRERAGSFREIEDSATKDREHKLMVEEQLQIEQQIQEGLRMKKEAERKASKTAKNRRGKSKKDGIKKDNQNTDAKNTDGKKNQHQNSDKRNISGERGINDGKNKDIRRRKNNKANKDDNNNDGNNDKGSQNESNKSSNGKTQFTAKPNHSRKNECVGSLAGDAKPREQ